MKRIFLGVIWMALGIGWANGQAGGPDALERRLFPPELIMRHQRALGLDEQQRGFIVREIQSTQSEFTSLQWKLEQEIEVLAGLLDEAGASEEEVLQQLDTVLDLERNIKRKNLLLAVRIKNRLTEEQQVRLQELREASVPGSERMPSRPRRTRPGRMEGVPAFR